MISKLSSENNAGLPHLLPPNLRQKVALPLHVQKLQRALDLDKFIGQVEQVYKESLAMGENAK